MSLRVSDYQATEQNDVNNRAAESQAGVSAENEAAETKEQENTTPPDKPTFEKDLSQIDPSTDRTKNRAIIADLPREKDGQPVAAENMRFEDYERAFIRSGLRDLGLKDATDTEIRAFQSKYETLTNDRIGLRSSVSELREEQVKGEQSNMAGKLRVNVSDYDLAVLDAGKRDILRQRVAQEEREVKGRKDGQANTDNIIPGFYKIQFNAVSRSLDGPAKLIGLPELPRLEVKGDYWEGRSDKIEKTLSHGADLLLGGAGTVGKVFNGLSTVSDGAELATGKDLRTGEKLQTDDKVHAGYGVASDAGKILLKLK